MDKGLLHLVVGVAGDCDIPDEALGRMKEQLMAFFALLNRQYPHTPILVLSSLAQKSDRLAAGVALEQGADLYVVLPMPSELYEKEFSAAESLEEFRRLRGQSIGATVTPPTPGDRRYLQAAAFLASYSKILIAVCNEHGANRTGGSQDAVKFTLEGVPTEYVMPDELLQVEETGAVYTVNDTSWKFRNPGDGATSYADAEASFRRNLRCLEEFNQDSVELGPRYSGEVRDSANGLLSSDDMESLHIHDAGLEYIRDLYSYADILSGVYRKRTHRHMDFTFLFIFLAAVFFFPYAHGLQMFAGWFGAFLTCVLFAVFIYLGLKRGRFQDRFQDYRALAEGLRVQFYWRLAGIGESVSNHYLARQAGELSWLRDAMQAARLRGGGRSGERDGERFGHVRMKAVISGWIDDQRDYFVRAAKREQDKGIRCKRWIWASLAAAGSVAVVWIGWLIYTSHHVLPTKNPDNVHAVLAVALTLLVAVAGLLTTFRDKRAYQEHARRYERMHALYRVAAERLRPFVESNDLIKTRATLTQLGKEALAETCDWLLLHREREIEIPTG